MAAAALPLIIHLLSRRRAKDVPFPSIEFLERMKTERMRRLRLRQLLLILVRTFIIAVIVLAFARPAVNSSFRRNARTSAAIVIDSSASMGYVNDGESLFQAAVRRAGEVLGMLERGDTVALHTTADGQPLPATGKDEAAEALETLGAPRGSGDPTAALERAVTGLERSGDPNRELYFITDGADNALPDSIPESAGVRLYVVRVGPETRGGAVIDDLAMTDKLVTVGEQVTFAARVRFGGDEAVEADVEFFVDGERKGRAAVAPGGGGSAEAVFTHIPDRPGWYSVLASVNDGRFSAGENRRFVMHVPRKASVLIAGGSAEDMYFLEKALNPDPDRAMFSLRRVLNDGFTQADIAASDVVVLAGVESLPESLYRSLVTAVVERGLGVVVFPPRTLDDSLYEEGIFRDLIPVEVENRVTLDGGGGAFARMDWFDLTHPILRGVSTGGEFTKPVVTSFLRLDPRAGVRTIARFSDDSMAMGEAVCGKGRVVLFSVDSSMRDSELPMTGIFIPLFIRTVQNLADAEIAGGRYRTGEVIDEYLGDMEEHVTVRLTPEDGPVRTVEVRHGESGARVTGIEATVPGFHSLYAGEREVTRFCVNTPREEIVYTRAGSERTAEAFKGMEYDIVDETGDLAGFVMDRRFGRELFGLFMLAAFGLIAVEMVLSRKA